MITVEFEIKSPITSEISLPLQKIGGDNPPATYRNSDSSFSVDIDAGEEFIADDVVISTAEVGVNDIDGEVVPALNESIPANTDYEVELVVAMQNASTFAGKRNLKPGQQVYSEDINILNTAGDLLKRVKHTPTLLENGDVVLKPEQPVISDVVNIDSDGQEAPTPAGVPFIATPAPSLVVGPCRLKQINPADIDPSYTSRGTGDLIDLCNQGVFDDIDHSPNILVERKVNPSDPYSLLPETPNPAGNLDRYTLIDFTPADVDRTTWSSGVQVLGKEYFVIDWAIEFGFLQNNIVVDIWSNCLAQVQALNTASHKGFDNWFMMSRRICEMSFCPDPSVNHDQSDHNFAKKGIVSGQNELWMWLCDCDYDSANSVFTEFQGDYARRTNTQTSTGLYVARRVSLADYQQYL